MSLTPHKNTPRGNPAARGRRRVRTGRFNHGRMLIGTTSYHEGMWRENHTGLDRPEPDLDRTCRPWPDGARSFQSDRMAGVTNADETTSIVTTGSRVRVPPDPPVLWIRSSVGRAGPAIESARRGSRSVSSLLSSRPPFSLIAMNAGGTTLVRPMARGFEAPSRCACRDANVPPNLVIASPVGFGECRQDYR